MLWLRLSVDEQIHKIDQGGACGQGGFSLSLCVGMFDRETVIAKELYLILRLGCIRECIRKIVGSSEIGKGATRRPRGLERSK